MERPLEPPTWAELGAKGKLIRIRQCAFDDDISDILDRIAAWSGTPTSKALAECIKDIRDILDEES